MVCEPVVDGRELGVPGIMPAEFPGQDSPEKVLLVLVEPVQFVKLPNEKSELGQELCAEAMLHKPIMAESITTVINSFFIPYF
jgi:hypothetical protein